MGENLVTGLIRSTTEPREVHMATLNRTRKSQANANVDSSATFLDMLSSSDVKKGKSGKETMDLGGEVCLVLSPQWLRGDMPGTWLLFAIDGEACLIYAPGRCEKVAGKVVSQTGLSSEFFTRDDAGLVSFTRLPKGTQVTVPTSPGKGESTKLKSGKVLAIDKTQVPLRSYGLTVEVTASLQVVKYDEVKAQADDIIRAAGPALRKAKPAVK